MKKLFLICIITGIYLNVYSQSGVYHHFPTHDAAWKEEIHNYIPQTSAMMCDHYQIEITGDTLAGSYTYHKLRKRGYHWDYWWCGAPSSIYTPSFFDGYAGAIREDTNLKKVYLLLPGHTTDTLLYDFDLHPGDTLPKTCLGYFSDVLTVTLVDSVLVGSQYHKRFGLSGYGFGGPDTNFVYLIEGIGSTFGLLNQIHAMWEVPDGSSLECFIQNGLTVYPTTGYNCSLLTVIEYQGTDSHEFTLSPNPTTGLIRLSFAEAAIDTHVEVLNCFGQLILSKDLSNQTQTTLDLTKYSKDLYFIKVQSLKGMVVKKVIIE